MEISSTGEGLDIILRCQASSLQNWMTFASWYSIQKNLPDANVVIACERSVQERQWYDWVRRCKVKFFQFQEKLSPVSVALNRKLIQDNKPLEIEPHVMAVREYNCLEVGPDDVRSNSCSTFIFYLEGCGKFVVSEWIDRLDNPFNSAVKKFGTSLMSINEIAVLKMWQQMNTIYSAL